MKAKKVDERKIVTPVVIRLISFRLRILTIFTFWLGRWKYKPSALEFWLFILQYTYVNTVKFVHNEIPRF